MIRDVIVREVGLRDGLQGVEKFFPTVKKIAWLHSEAAAGVPEIEVCSFVPARIAPQFTDCAEVVAAALQIDGLTASALIPNQKGAMRGFELGVRKLNFVLSVSESHNQRNVRCSTAESIEKFRQIADLRAADPAFADTKLVGGMATALGCTIEGRIDPAAVVRVAEQLAAAGADEISIADTVGYADPGLVKSVFKQVRAALGDDIPLSGHFHDTRGLGLSNVHAALEAGVRRFDASLAGLGGCPFAPGATGNIVMDDLVFMLESMGLKTGVDLEALLAVREIVATTLPDETLYGAIARAGLPKGFAGAEAA